MFKTTNKSFEEIIGSIPSHFKILDVGAASAPTKRANHLIDIVPYEKIHHHAAKGPGEIKFSKQTYHQFDVCQRKKWPFNDKEFDYCICSQLLEDVRDPLWVLSEIIRISKAGYIEVPSRKYETSYGIEGRQLAGAVHHRWIIDTYENKLRFTFKYSWVHLPYVANKKPPKGNDRNLKIEWQDSINYFENVINDGPDIINYFLNKKDAKTISEFNRKLFNENIIINKIKYLYHNNDIFKKALGLLKLKK